MLIPAHEYCILLLLVLLGTSDMKRILKNPLGKWLIILWCPVACIDLLTIYDELGSHSILYFFSGCCLSLVIPLAFLFIRQYHMRKPIHSRDKIHLIPLALFSAALFIFSFFPGAFALSYRSFYGMFGYGISIVYIAALLVQYYHSLKSPDRNKEEKDLPFKGIPVEKLRNKEEVKEWESVIQRIMDSEAPYLQQKYSIGDLSAQTGYPLHQLSAFINGYYKMNFNDFINKRRLEYFRKKLTEDQAWEGLTLEGIAKESGFGNRNTFTKAFKKFYGTTPAAFLKSIKKSERSTLQNG